MAQQPTTWKTVTAPSFNAANNLAMRANVQSSNALGNLGNQFDTFIQKRQEDATNMSVATLRQAEAGGASQEDLASMAAQMEGINQETLNAELLGISDRRVKADNNAFQRRVGESNLLSNELGQQVTQESIANMPQQRAFELQDQNNQNMALANSTRNTNNQILNRNARTSQARQNAARGQAASDFRLSLLRTHENERLAAKALAESPEGIKKANDAYAYKEAKDLANKDLFINSEGNLVKREKGSDSSSFETLAHGIEPAWLGKFNTDTSPNADMVLRYIQDAAQMKNVDNKFLKRAAGMATTGTTFDADLFFGLTTAREDDENYRVPNSGTVKGREKIQELIESGQKYQN